MLNYILLLFMSLSPAATIYVDDGCEAKSQWGIEYKWTSVNISAWIPYEEDTQILTIEIELEDLKHPVNYDNLNVYKKEIKFEEIRDGESKSEGKSITNQKPGHWTNFAFNMDTHYGFMSLSTLNELLFRKEIKNNPTKFTIKGSNVTVYCHDNSRMWNVGEDKSAVIPLENEKVSSFILYSTKEFTGELELEKRKFSLGWQNGALTTIPEAGAMPRFEQHHVELHCREEDKVKCDIKVGENRDTVEKDILMSAMPKTMTVKSEKGRFFVIKKGVSHEESSKTAPETMLPEATLLRCDVKPKWEIDYKWPRVEIGSWVPHEENSTILTIKIEIEGYKTAAAYDRLSVSNHEIKFTRWREDKLEEENALEIPYLPSGHWADFVFHLDSHYFIMYMNNGKEIFKKEIDTRPTKLSVTGSNITVNCPSNTRVWNVDEKKPVVIPLDSQDVQSFIFFSTKDFKADLELGKMKYSIGWHNGALTMIPDDAGLIPPFGKHLVELLCRTDEKVMCDIKIGENRDIAVKEQLMRMIPKFITVSSGEGEFFVIKEGIPRLAATFTPTTEKTYIEAWTILISFAVILLIAVIILGFFVLKNRNVMRFSCRRSERNEEENEETQERESLSKGKDLKVDEEKAEIKRLMIEEKGTVMKRATHKTSGEDHDVSSPTHKLILSL